MHAFQDCAPALLHKFLANSVCTNKIVLNIYFLYCSFPRISEEQRWSEWEASVHIQAWFRAVRVRSYLKHLHRCATTLQKTWRGFLGRAFVRILIENQVLIMRRNFYNAMATVVSIRSLLNSSDQGVLGGVTCVCPGPPPSPTISKSCKFTFCIQLSKSKTSPVILYFQS